MPPPVLKYSLIVLVSLATGVALSRWTPAGDQTLPHGKIHPASAGPESAAARVVKDVRAEAMEEALLHGNWKAVAKKWAAEDPQGFHQWILRQDPAPPLELVKTLFLSWVLADTDAAFNAAVNLPRRFQRGEFIPEMLASLLQAGTHDELALRWIPKVGGEFSGFSWANPAFLTRKPPEEAAALLKGAGNDFYGGTLLTQLGQTWAEKDLDAARKWLESLPVEKRAQALDGIMQVWAKKDTQGALDYLAQAGTAERHYIYEPLAQLTAKDPAAAFQWWEENMGVPDSNTLRYMLNKWREIDADKAKQYVLGIEDPALRHQFLTEYVSDAGKEAVSLVMSLPAGGDREAVAQAIAYTWARNDPKAALAYLNSEPSPEAGRTAAISMVNGIGYNEPAQAFQWAQEVPEQWREQAVLAAIERWRDKDAVAAAAAVNGLPPGKLKTAAEKVLNR